MPREPLVRHGGVAAPQGPLSLRQETPRGGGVWGGRTANKSGQDLLEGEKSAHAKERGRPWGGKADWIRYVVRFTLTMIRVQREGKPHNRTHVPSFTPPKPHHYRETERVVVETTLAPLL